MTHRSEEQSKTYLVIEYFRRELKEAQKRDESGLHVTIGREGPVRFVLSNPYKDAADDMEMSGAEADSTFLREVQEGFIGVTFDSGGPNASTAGAFVTHITPKGLKMLDEWEEASPPPTQQFTFNAPAYGAFGSQQNFTFEQVIQDLDRQIQENGEDNKEELREMMEEIRQTLESQDSINRSKFEKWSELVHKHMPWLTGPLGALLIKYGFGLPG